MKYAKRRLSMCAISLITAFLMMGCQNTATRSDEGAQTTNETQQAKRDFINQVEVDLGSAERAISDLSKKAESQGDTLEAETRDKIDALQGKLDDAKDKLNELRAAGDDSWEQIKDQMSETMDSLDEMYHNVRSHV